MKILLGLCLLATLVSCGSSQSKYLGTWVETKNHADRIQIARNGDGCIITMGDDHVPADYKGSSLVASSPLGPVTLTYVEDSDTLLCIFPLLGEGSFQRLSADLEKTIAEEQRTKERNELERQKAIAEINRIRQKAFFDQQKASFAQESERQRKINEINQNKLKVEKEAFDANAKSLSSADDMVALAEKEHRLVPQLFIDEEAHLTTFANTLLIHSQVGSADPKCGPQTGFLQSYQSVFGRANVLVIHPLNGNENGILDLSNITKTCDGQLILFSHNYPNGNAVLKVLVEEHPFVSFTTTDGLWHAHTIPFHHEAVSVAVLPGTWNWQHAFLQLAILQSPESAQSTNAAGGLRITGSTEADVFLQEALQGSKPSLPVDRIDAEVTVTACKDRTLVDGHIKELDPTAGAFSGPLMRYEQLLGKKSVCVLSSPTATTNGSCDLSKLTATSHGHLYLSARNLPHRQCDLIIQVNNHMVRQIHLFDDNWNALDIPFNKQYVKVELVSGNSDCTPALLQLALVEE